MRRGTTLSPLSHHARQTVGAPPMDPLPNSPTPSAPPRSLRPARGLLRRLYTSNPFYVISADLVFVGLRMSLETSGTTFETWALMLGIAGYTLLLATTACVLIRLGNVWDDLRTVLLLVVMMFLALSVTFDETLTSNPRFGVACDVAGLLFAVFVSEGVLRVIRLRLPALFRVPYYLILSLFFLYPAALVSLLGDPASPALQWALFGFSPLAGLVFLSLLPAIRRGPQYVEQERQPVALSHVSLGALWAARDGRLRSRVLPLHFVAFRRAHIVLLRGTLAQHFRPVFPGAVLVRSRPVAARTGDRRAQSQRAPNRDRRSARTRLLASVGPAPDPVYQGFLLIFSESGRVLAAVSGVRWRPPSFTHSHSCVACRWPWGP